LPAPLTRLGQDAGRRKKTKKAEKARAVLARREADTEPRPARISAPEPAASETSEHASDDFAVVRATDRFWND
jgi:hypothetical protein